MFTYKKHILNFNKPATTSRGSMQTHTVYYILKQDSNNTILGIGEAAPLSGLSIDASENFENGLILILEKLNDGVSLKDIDLDKFPSIEFALETAMADFNFGGTRNIIENKFFEGEQIPINGLVWMNKIDEMYEEAIQKIAQGFNCIKFKIGALDFDEECRLIEKIRKQNSAFKLEIRLDANGAFSNDDALKKLNELKRFEIQSIEQPIKAKQLDLMQELCVKTPIPIALDEELIGVNQNQIKLLLSHIKPQYIILKPTLIGGLAKSKIWLTYAQSLGIDAWFTSALESNIGLNAIAQFCSSLNPKLHQGLGTGSLYKNNVPSPLFVQNGYIQYLQNKPWDLSQITTSE